MSLLLVRKNYNAYSETTTTTKGTTAMFKTVKKVRDYVYTNPERVILIASTFTTGVLLAQYQPWKNEIFLVDKQLMKTMSDGKCSVFFATKKYGEVLMNAIPAVEK